MEEGCDLLFIVNPNIQLEEQGIDILVKRIKSDEMIGVIEPIILYGYESQKIIHTYGLNADFRTQKKRVNLIMNLFKKKCGIILRFI